MARRYTAAVLVILLSLLYIFSTMFEDYENISSHLGERFLPARNYSVPANGTFNGSEVTTFQEPIGHYTSSFSYKRRANATFVFLCRNSDLPGVVSSIQQMEDRFNRNYHYPWVFLNEEPFTEEFKRRVTILTDAPVSFGQIPRNHWYQPDWINESQAREERMRMTWKGIIYAAIGICAVLTLVSFFNMNFSNHTATTGELSRPGVKFFCDVPYDPFLFMEENEKIYGFTLSLLEWEPTIPTLWSAVKEFTAQYPHYVEPQNSMDFVSDDGGETYNLCHYWSNFEIADMEFWRGDAYQAFFNHLESKGGFYYERWGDAPVHSIAASLFARKDQIHFFRDIGYRHDPFQHCPKGDEWAQGRCSCDPNDSFDYEPNSCTKRYENLFK